MSLRGDVFGTENARVLTEEDFFRRRAATTHAARARAIFGPGIPGRIQCTNAVTSCSGEEIHGLAPDIPIRTIYGGVAPFIVADLALVALLTVFPAISLWLPRLVA